MLNVDTQQFVYSVLNFNETLIWQRQWRSSLVAYLVQLQDSSVISLKDYIQKKWKNPDPDIYFFRFGIYNWHLKLPFLKTQTSRQMMHNLCNRCREQTPP